MLKWARISHFAVTCETVNNDGHQVRCKAPLAGWAKTLTVPFCGVGWRVNDDVDCTLFGGAAVGITFMILYFINAHKQPIWVLALQLT